MAEANDEAKPTEGARRAQRPRAAFADVGTAMRLSLRRAVDGGASNADLAVLAAVFAGVASWSRLEDNYSVAQLAVDLGHWHGSPGTCPPKTRHRLGQRLVRLAALGAIHFEHGHGRRSSLITLPESPAEGESPSGGESPATAYSESAPTAEGTRPPRPTQSRPPRPTQSRPPRPIHREVSRGGTPRRVPPEENFEQATAPPTGGRDGAAASGTPTRKAKTTRRAKATPDPETARREAEERAAAHAAKVAEDEARTRQEVIARLEADLGQRLDDLTDVELPADAGELRDLLKRHRVPFPTALRRTGKTTAAAIVADRDVLRLLVATLGAAA